jgi:hypothetical protein
MTASTASTRLTADERQALADARELASTRGPKALCRLTGTSESEYLSVAYGRALAAAQDRLNRLAAIIERLDDPQQLTNTDREYITEARRVGPGLRASSSDRDRKTGWLLQYLAERLESL